MSLRLRFRSWQKALGKRARLEEEMDEELRFHLEAYAEDLLGAGMSEAEAKRRARLEFGNAEVHKEDARAVLGLRFWDDLRADIRYALRSFRRTPALALVAVVSLALGIGANTTIFSLINSVLLEKLAVPDPDGLKTLSWSGDDHVVVHSMWGASHIGANGRTSSDVFSYPVYRQMRAQCGGIAELFAFKALDGNRRLSARIDGSTETATAELVSGNYFAVLGLKPQLGRLISESDDERRGEAAVAVLSDHYWSARFGRSRGVLGQTISLNHVPVTIVGVAPVDFGGVKSVLVGRDLFLPFSLQPNVLPIDGGSVLDNKELWWVPMMGRLRPGVSTVRAQAEIGLQLQRAVRDSMVVPSGGTVPDALVQPGSRGPNFLGQQEARPLTILLALVGFVLLLACLNIANLLLARAKSREREISVRVALGAGRQRLFRQMLTESLLLSAAGGVAGLLLGFTSRNFIPQFLMDAWNPNRIDIHFNWHVLAFSGAITMGAGLLFGLAPAWRAARTDLNGGTKEQGLRTHKGVKSRTSQGLVVLQISLSLVLVMVAGLFLRTLVNLSHTNIGFDASNLLLFEIQPPAGRYDRTKSERLLHEIEERLRALPGVEDVGMSMEPLLAGSMSNSLFFLPGEPVERGPQHSSYWNVVNAKFFGTLRIPMLRGRPFGEADAALGHPLVILNQAAAKKFFPHSNPVGQQLVGEIRTGREHYTIVGVVGDAEYDDVRGAPPPTVYGYYRQWQEPLQMTFEIRAKRTPQTLAAAARKAVQSIDESLPLVDMRTQRQQIEALTIEQRLFAALATAFGALALAIASVGIFGLMAFSVATRRSEIGIRMALGAQRQQVLGMVLRETGGLTLVGVGIGIGVALMGTKVLRSMLFGLAPDDPLMLGLSSAILLATAIAAGWVPARRAAKTDPLEALRHD